MQKRSSDEIRNLFLSFFESKNHLIIPGAKLRPNNDPTLLYINSGMAPLKPYFLGEASPPSPRLVNVQTCIRTNDIEEVGDRHHLTFFEMLGSWSIGDYYKEKAIELAFELLVDKFGFKPNKLYATVFKGNPSLGLPPDDDSAQFWERVGLPSDHIVMLGMDNFWGPAGDTGPCGPCTEVFYDTGDAYGPRYVPGDEFDTRKRYIEIWNAGVFMQYNKKPDGTFDSLPMKSVDTGSGLERMQLTINGYDTAYETDLLKPVLNVVISTFGEQLSERERFILTDHMRATTFILSEGVIPTNVGQGYVPRRLIRKCVALATRVGQRGQQLINVVDTVIERMHRYYPHLSENRTQIIDLLLAEVKDFEPIIERGLERLEKRLVGLQSPEISGSTVFEIVTTYGVPLEVVKEYLAAKKISFDEETYWTEFRRHQDISRTGLTADSALVPQVEGLPATTFTGYETVRDEGTVIQAVVDNSPLETVKEGQSFILVVDRTPFYAEAGGQVGDTGTGETETGKFEIANTVKEGDVYLHHATVLSGTIRVGQRVVLAVDSKRRERIRLNHTATHLLQSALRSVLGEHVVQQGSLVAPDRLRFDFRHNEALSPEDIQAVEERVNTWIRHNAPTNITVKSYQDAISSGAIALFSETYGDTVRVISIDDISTELCGGTHVKATGDIGIFLIKSERSIAKGIRRIEAVTGEMAYQEARNAISTIRDIASKLKTSPDNTVQTLDRVLSAKQESNASASLSVDDALQQFKSKDEFETESKIKAFVGHLNVPADMLREVAERLINSRQHQIVTIVSNSENKLSLVVMVASAVNAKLPANKLLKEFLSIIDGKGGGKADTAMGGSKEVDRLDDLLKKSREIINAFAGKAS